MISVSADKNKLDIPFILSELKQVSWLAPKTQDEVQIVIDASFCFGIYLNDKQIGFCRIITDYVVFAYVMDVFITAEQRGKGYASILINTMLSEPKLQEVKLWRLATADAHFLYKKFGFDSLAYPNKMMEKLVKTF
ncbi:GNAT family N-acetyltransferase [Flavobacterium sp.]|jgi:GNAT superfamily N-acetyltransferase|uniref:GNAT family N-acetyltransferase n=1 Tax=Flavobacterium sp. TaxID=239 RepID=UPI0037C12787